MATPYAALAAPALCAGLAGATALAGRRRNALAGALAALAVLQTGRLLLISGTIARTEVDTGRGSLWLPSDQASAWQGAISWLHEHGRPGDELAGFPEAGLFHLATGLRNPLRQDQVLPGHLDSAGERDVIARLRERRPRFVVLVNQPSAAFGPVSFGDDYAVRVWATVLDGWSLVARFGGAGPAEPVGPGPFFVRVYERREAPSRHAGSATVLPPT